MGGSSTGMIISFPLVREHGISAFLWPATSPATQLICCSACQRRSALCSSATLPIKSALHIARRSSAGLPAAVVPRQPSSIRNTWLIQCQAVRTIQSYVLLVVDAATHYLNNYNPLYLFE